MNPTEYGAAWQCLGCAMPDADGRHQCAKDRALEPYGGFCQCTRAGCGPKPRN